jgi:heme-degrading monooxygenase HmoA
MYGVTRKYRFKPGGKEEVLRKAEEEFVHIVSDSPGFVAYHIIHEGDHGVTISIFETEAEAEESMRRAASFVREHLLEHLEGPLDVVQGEVAVSKIAAGQ